MIKFYLSCESRTFGAKGKAAKQQAGASRSLAVIRNDLDGNKFGWFTEMGFAKVGLWGDPLCSLEVSGHCCYSRGEVSSLSGEALVGDVN